MKPIEHKHDLDVHHSVTVSETLKQRIAKVKQHLQDNKGTYLTGAGCLALGLVGGTQFKRPIVIDFKPVINNMPTFNNNNIGNVVENTVNNVGHCCKIVQDLDNPEKLWPKAKILAEELAEEHGVSFDVARIALSKHLNGHSENAFGKHYVTYGLGTTG